MFSAGVELMVVGMGTVFAFLGLLVGLMHVSARVIAALSPPALEQPPSDEEEAEVAVVLAAVAAARQRAAGRSA